MLHLHGHRILVQRLLYGFGRLQTARAQVQKLTDLLHQIFLLIARTDTLPVSCALSNSRQRLSRRKNLEISDMDCSQQNTHGGNRRLSAALSTTLSKAERPPQVFAMQVRLRLYKGLTPGDLLVARKNSHEHKTCRTRHLSKA